MSSISVLFDLAILFLALVFNQLPERAQDLIAEITTGPICGLFNTCLLSGRF